LRALSTTIVFTVVCVTLKFAIGLGAALLIHHVPRWGSVLGGLALLPYIIPDTVKALAWRVLLDPLFGVMNYILVNVLGIMDRGLPWLGDPSTALPSVRIVATTGLEERVVG
jgi:ABC-type sugar transport system permease subunit